MNYFIIISILFVLSILTVQSSQLPKAELSARIVNGHPTYHGQFPFQVLVLPTFANGQNVCGGVLLSTDWIITAAHCAIGAIEFELHLGAQRFADTANEEKGRLVDRTSTYHVHFRFNPVTFANDVAMIRLSRSVAFTERISAAQLPRNTDGGDRFVGRRAIASGWGLKHTHDTTVASQLQWAPLTVVSNAWCARIYGNTIVVDTTLCAEGEAMESVCNGDSGGPLVLASDNRTLIGVTSFGHPLGCHIGIRQGFSRISEYVGWIDGIMGE